MIEIYFNKNIDDRKKLEEFLIGETESYNRKNNAFILTPTLDFKAINQYYLTELEKTFNDQDYKTKRVDDRSFHVIGVTKRPIWMLASNNSYWEESLFGKIPDKFLEKIGTKERKTWYGEIKTPSFRRVPYVSTGGGFTTDIDDTKQLNPCLEIISKKGYKYEITTEMDRLKREISDLESRAEKRWINLGP